jgi:hypothetical protein
MPDETNQPDLPLFSVKNHHIESCGKPPSITDGDGPRYRGYFENEYGEQAIFVYDWQKREGTLYLGDAGWEKPYRVVAPGRAEGGLVMGAEERAWLAACWAAATANGKR